MLPGLLLLVPKYPWICGSHFAKYSLLYSLRRGNNIFEAIPRRSAGMGHDQKKNRFIGMNYLPTRSFELSKAELFESTLPAATKCLT